MNQELKNMKITLLTGKTSNLPQKIQSELDFPVKINISPRAKKLTLRIDSKERIPVLTIPKRCSVKQVVEFATQHKPWIMESLTKIPVSKTFEDGETFSFFGQEVTIRHNPTLRRGVFIENNILYVSGEKEFLHRRIRDFIKKQAEEIFYAKSQELAQKIGCRVKDVTIKDTKSRWGSCSSMCNINYSWRIALAPEFVINYLIAHEVSHLKHQNHSRNFWNCVRTLEPECSRGRLWLKLHGKELYLYE